MKQMTAKFTLADGSVLEIGSQKVENLQINYTEGEGMKSLSLMNYPKDGNGFVLKDMAGRLILANEQVLRAQLLLEDSLVSEITDLPLSVQYNVNYGPSSLMETIRVMTVEKGDSES